MDAGCGMQDEGRNFEPRQFRQSHLVNRPAHISGSLPDFQRSIAHKWLLLFTPGFGLFPHPASYILHSRIPDHTKIVCSRAGPTEAIASLAPVSSAIALR